jgi:predicted DNA-binding transcriptional regulator YafY
MEWVIKYGPSAEILEPVEVRERFKQRLQQWLTLYG